MSNPPRFLTRRRTLAIACLLTLLLGVPMLHPYPRQSLFGPTIRGEPWCVWEEEIRRQANPAVYQDTLWFWFRVALGIEPAPMAETELYDHADMLPLILVLAADKDRNVRSEMLRAIRNYDCLRNPSCVPRLRACMAEDDYQENRLRAAFLLWEMTKDKQALPVIARDMKNRECIECSDGTFMCIVDGGDAMQRLGRICVEALEMMPTLCEFARHPDFNNYSSAALHVGTQLGDNKGIPVLAACLENKEPYVRSRAAIQLIRRGPKAKEAVPALLRCLNDPNDNLRWVARDALISIDPKRFGHLTVTEK